MGDHVKIPIHKTYSYANWDSFNVCRLFIKRYVGAEEYINDKKRYCLWLKNVSPKLYEDIPEIIARIRHVAAFRMKSPTKSVREDAKRPMLFTQDRQPDTDYLIVPQVSSSTRKYIPVGFISKEVIASNGVYIIPTSDIYMFGILTSSVHMDWMRVVSGRLKSDYRYSPAVYNNFPWPSANEHQKNKIVKTAQKIIEVRSKHTDSSFAEMYGQNMYLYADLVDAHEANDRAVMEAYGFDKNMTEPEIVAELMKMYQQLTEKQNN